MFSKETIDEIENVARQEGIDPAALLAVAEVESGGRAFAYIGGRKEPLIRFEGHYYDRLLGPEDRALARKNGLSSPKAGEIKNPRLQADRWRLLEKAIKINEAAALQSVSWGIGQVMGVHYQLLGYPAPQALAQEARSSIAGQVRLMVRFIRKNGLFESLEKRDWAEFSRRYNGPAYRRNNYDTRIAAAYARHSKYKLKRPIAERLGIGLKTTYLRAFLPDNDVQKVRALQSMLTAAGHAVQKDGVFGVETDRALRQFQLRAKLAVDGVFGPKSEKALKKALPRLGRFSSILVFLWRLIRLSK